MLLAFNFALFFAGPVPIEEFRFSNKVTFSPKQHFMPTWLSAILEIVKLTVPALIVYFTVSSLMKAYLEKQLQLRQLEFKQGQLKTTVPLRLQAYERLSLFCERIAIPSLLLRCKEDGQKAGALRLKLLLSIQQEFEYNITQQLYVSEQLWQIIRIARDDSFTVINGIAEKVPASAPAEQLADELMKFLNENPVSTLDKAIQAIKKEVAILM
jgi:hypothetical protein